MFLWFGIIHRRHDEGGARTSPRTDSYRIVCVHLGDEQEALTMTLCTRLYSSHKSTSVSPSHQRGKGQLLLVNLAAKQCQWGLAFAVTDNNGRN
jgi:hypothetical protein